MKRIACLFTVGILFILSCRKDTEAIEGGQWRWLTTYQDGFIEHIITPDADSVVTLSLNADSTYATYVNSKIVYQGRYSITQQQDNPVIHFDKNISTNKLIINQDEMLQYFGTDSLNLFDYKVEGTSHYFKKVH